MTLLTRIQTESILLESDIKELIDILISPSIGTDIKYELLSSYSEREIQQQELTYIVRSLINTMYPHQPCYEGGMCVCGTGGDKSNSSIYQLLSLCCSKCWRKSYKTWK